MLSDGGNKKWTLFLLKPWCKYIIYMYIHVYTFHTHVMTSARKHLQWAKVKKQAVGWGANLQAVHLLRGLCSKYLRYIQKYHCASSSSEVKHRSWAGSSCKLWMLYKEVKQLILQGRLRQTQQVNNTETSGSPLNWTDSVGSTFKLGFSGITLVCCWFLVTSGVNRHLLMSPAPRIVPHKPRQQENGSGRAWAKDQTPLKEGILIVNMRHKCKEICST